MLLNLMRFLQLECQPVQSARRAGRRRRPRVSRQLFLERLEDRTVPSLVVGQSYDGVDSNSAGGWRPPDTNAAVGNNFVVETVNMQIRIFDKTTQAVLLDESLDSFFGQSSYGDPYVVYDDIADRWYVSAFDGTTTGLLLAVSGDGNPVNGSWTTYNLTNVGGFPDYAKMGFNKDAIFISYNDFGSSGEAAIASIDKAAALTGTLSYFVSYPAYQFRAMPPAQMHGDTTGGVEWFVSTDGTDSGGSTIRVTKMENYLSDSPIFTYTSLDVTPYQSAVQADEPGGGSVTVFPNTTTYQVQYRNGHLVTAMASATASDGYIYPKGLYYQIDISGGTPTLLQEGVIDPGPGVAVQMPSVDEDIYGNLGFTWIESSTSEYLSMWIGGLDTSGNFESSQVAPGGGPMYWNDRIGDYSTTVLDPSDGVTFWSANEYVAIDDASNAWWTHIASFTVTTPAPGLYIKDVSVTEGNSGTVEAKFTVQLVGVSDAVSVDWATADGSATTADSDYLPAAGTLNFAPGDTTQTFTVLINGDWKDEANENFFVNLSNAVGADIIDAQGQGTIVDDDTAGFTLNPGSGLVTTESGGTDSFTVVLNSQPTANVTVNLSSSDTSEGTVSPASVVFTTSDWNVSKTITVTGVNDFLDDGDVSYHITASASSTDSKYNGLQAQISAVNQDNDASITYTSTDVPKTIPDAGRTPGIVTSTLTAGAFTILDVNVQLNISSGRDSDLDVFLYSPNGTKVELFTDVGGNGKNFTGTVLDDEASTSITAGTAPFTGSYKPEGSLAAFDGMNSGGTWRLEVQDDQKGAKKGTLNSWSITIFYELAGPTSGSPDGQTADASGSSSQAGPAASSMSASSMSASARNVVTARGLGATWRSDLPALDANLVERAFAANAGGTAGPGPTILDDDVQNDAGAPPDVSQARSSFAEFFSALADDAEKPWENGLLGALGA